MREDYLAERNRIIDETASSLSEEEAVVFPQAVNFKA